MTFPGTIEIKRGEPERLAIQQASSITPEPIDWLWDGWLAKGKLHVLAGAPGTGKTSVAVALAATLSIGGRWPDGTPSGFGSVLIWSGEDDLRDTLVPRLIACGADLHHVHFIGSVFEQDGNRSFDPGYDVPLLREAAAEMQPRPALLIVDPLVSAVTGDSHKNAEVRRALQPLADLAQTLDCAVLGISHFTKGTSGQDPVERVTGSLAFGALARIVLAAAKLPDEEGGGRMLARAKNNIGLDHGGFRYDLEPLELSDHPGVFTTRVLWGEALDGTARELLGRAETTIDHEEHSALADAKAFLLDMLADGPRPSREVRLDADGAGHSWATIRRAQKTLNIDIRKHGGRFGGGKQQWMWALPSRPIAEGDHQPEQRTMSTFCKNEHLLCKNAEGAQGARAQSVKGLITFSDGEHLGGEEAKRFWKYKKPGSDHWYRTGDAHAHMTTPEQVAEALAPALGKVEVQAVFMEEF